uniref:Transposable element Hobo transposase n=1 Tax=Panagrolaimus sp. PS1159 TaxID=55785 RepID=A0AC35EZB8_9BILA
MPLMGARMKSQKVYRGRMSKPVRAEVAGLFQSGILIKGAKTIGCIFSLVYADTKKEAASICSKCEQVFSISKSVRGTLHKHSNSHDTDDDTDAQPPAYFKVMLTKKLADMVSWDIVPFSVVENKGFKEVLELVFKAGFDFGKSVVKNKTPGVQVPSILEFIPTGKTVKKELLSWTFSFTEYDCKTTDADEVRKIFFSILGGHGIDVYLLRRNAIITTDRGSNLIAALNDFNRVDDLCHQLNILSKRIITPYKAAYITDQIQLTDAVKESLTTVDKCLKAMTKIIKAIHSRPELRKKLKSLGIAVKRHVETRWLSRYLSILSYVKMNEEQKQLVRDQLYDYKFNGR